jgi:hypothetical protein
MCTIHGVIQAAVARSNCDGVRPQYEVQLSHQECLVHAEQCQQKPFQSISAATAFTGVCLSIQKRLAHHIHWSFH